VTWSKAIVRIHKYLARAVWCPEFVHSGYAAAAAAAAADDDDDKRQKCDKEAEKILKYKDLITEMQRVWYVKTPVTPVIIGATGAISESFRKYLSSVPGKHDVKELQKTATLCTAHTLRKVLM
jgi:hypothetical protein